MAAILPARHELRRSARPLRHARVRPLGQDRRPRRRQRGASRRARGRGLDVRVLLPAYRPVLAATAAHRRRARGARGERRAAGGAAARGATPERRAGVARSTARRSTTATAAPTRTLRPAATGPTTPLRFALLARVAAHARRRVEPARLAAARAPLQRLADGARAGVPALRRRRPRTRHVMCIHNLAFQGLFPPRPRPRSSCRRPPPRLDGAEFYGRLSFLKAGLVYADAITTVSPTYAQEIQREPLGFGLQGCSPRAPTTCTGSSTASTTGCGTPRSIRSSRFATTPRTWKPSAATSCVAGAARPARGPPTRRSSASSAGSPSRRAST